MKIKILVFLIIITYANIFAQVDRTKQPVPGPAPEIQLGDYESFELENGLKVFVITNNKLPQINFSLITDRDPIFEGKANGYISMAGDLLRRGTKTRTKEQIDEQIDFIGANLNTSGSSISGSSLTKHFDKLMDLFSDVLLNSEFKQDELDKIKTQTISSLAANKEEPTAIASNLRKILLYGSDHPYGEITTEESIEAISLEMCQKYYEDYFRPNISMLVFVGDITIDEAKEIAEKYLGKWKRKDIPSYEYKQPKAPIVRKVAISNRDASVQSVINVAYPLDLKKGSEDVIKVSVMNTILGGTYSARLNHNLRETKGYTYGSFSSLTSDKLVGRFNASATVRNSVTDSAIAEIIYEMNRLRNEKVDEAELSRIKNYLTGSFSRSLEEPATIARFALNMEMYNLPKDYYKNYLKNLNAVTANDVQEMAQKYLKPNNSHIIVVGNAEEVAEDLKKFSISEKLNYYDNYGVEYDPNVKKVEDGISAESVIEKYIESIGGREKLSGMKDKTMMMKGVVQGMDIRLTISQKAPNKLYQELDYSVGKQKTFFDGENGKIEGMGQEIVLEGDKLEEVKILASMNSFLDYKKNNIKLELSGIEKINNTEAYKVITVAESGKKTTHYYDKESGLKLREVSSVTTQQGSFSQIIDMEDYKVVDGIKFPFILSQKIGPQTVNLEVTSIKVNTGLDDSMFEVN